MGKTFNGRYDYDGVIGPHWKARMKEVYQLKEKVGGDNNNDDCYLRKE